VADSFTTAPTQRGAALAEMVVVVACLMAADAAPAHNVQAVAATAVTDSTRMAPARKW